MNEKEGAPAIVVDAQPVAAGFFGLRVPDGFAKGQAPGEAAGGEVLQHQVVAPDALHERAQRAHVDLGAAPGVLRLVLQEVVDHPHLCMFALCTMHEC